MEENEFSTTVDQQITKTTICSKPRNYCEDSDSNLSYNYQDVTKVKEEVEDSAGDDYYTSVSDPLKIDIKDEFDNNLIQTTAAESYTTNEDNSDRDDQHIVTVAGHPTSESLTTDNSVSEPTKPNNQHGEEITCHAEYTQFVTTSKKSHFCNVCHRTFTRPSHLATHERTHTGDKPHICSVCYKSFSRLDNLVRHERTHMNDKPHVCSLCHKAFSEAWNLERHERIHTGEKPLVCYMCPKAFRQACDLVKHIRAHTGEKPYVCNVCQKTFSQSSNLMKHKRTHTGDT